MRKYDLEDRLIRYVISVWELLEKLEPSPFSTYITGHMLRSGASPALNYGEAQSAESQKDFIHKLKISLKELRETKVCLKIIREKPLIKDFNQLNSVFSETDELLAIFTQSIKTASLKLKK